MTINRFCSSGMQAIGIAAQRIIVDGVPIVVAGGLKSVSLTQKNLNHHRETDDWLLANKPEIYWSMIETADLVARRYQITRDRQDEFACESQRRTAAAQEAGRFDAEIVPVPSTKIVIDKNSGEAGSTEVCLAADEGNRPDTTLEHSRVSYSARRWPVCHRGQREPTVRRRVGMCRHRCETRGAAQPRRLGLLSRHRGCRLRAGGNGHRARVRRAEAPRAPRVKGRRHRPLGTERGVRPRRLSIAATGSAFRRTG